MIYDFVIIGAGVVGTAVARELSRTQATVALVERGNDVGIGTSKANTAILHTGFDARPGSLEARLVREGYALLKDYALASGIRVEKTGAILVAWNKQELETLPALKAKAEQNEYFECEIISAEAVYQQVPALGPGVLGGLTVPDESIIDPWSPSLAFATEAQANGADVILNTAVRGFEIGEQYTTVLTDSDPLAARWVINAAGLHADTLDRMFGHERFTVTPRRGELMVFDKMAADLVPKIVLPVPTALGKGVLVSPTVFGNVMLGPTAENLDDKRATDTSKHGFDFLREKGERLMPQLFDEEVTASYAGLRASIDHDDYLLEIDQELRYVLIGGIRSTGLTSSLSLAAHIVAELEEVTHPLPPRTAPAAIPQMPPLGERAQRPYQCSEMIAADGEYGKIVCFCERVTAGEVGDALNSAIPPVDRAGLSRRTRAMNGRCQGFFCAAALDRSLAAASNSETVRSKGMESA